MRVTDQAERLPRNCAVSGRADGPFLDFQVELDLPRNEPYHLYLHKLIVEAAAKKMGMVTTKEHDAVKTELEETRAKLQHLEDTLKLTAELEELVGRERIPDVAELHA